MMKGWKTWVGVAGFFITYVAANYFGVDMEAAKTQSGSFVELLNAAFGVLTVIGLGHKIEKNGSLG